MREKGGMGCSGVDSSLHHGKIQKVLSREENHANAACGIS